MGCQRSVIDKEYCSVTVLGVLFSENILIGEQSFKISFDKQTYSLIEGR